MRTALLSIAVSAAFAVALPAAAAADDLDLDFDAPAAKPAKKKPAKKAPAGDDLDLDFDAPVAKPAKAAKPAKGARPAAGSDLDLDFDLDTAPVKPANKPGKGGKPAKSGKKSASSLDLDLDGDDLDLAPVPNKNVPAKPPPKPQQIAPPKPAFVSPPVPSPDLPPGDDGFGELDAKLPYNRLAVGLKVGGLLFNARPGEVTFDAATGAPSAGRGATLPAMLEARFCPASSLPGLGVFFEAGFFPKSGDVARSLPDDPDFKNTTNSWQILAVPLALGVAFELPVRFNYDRMGLGLRAAAVGQYTRSSSSWITGGTSVTGGTQTGFALGYLAGFEVNYSAGPGAVVVDLRYAQAFTDLGLGKAYSAQGSQAAQPYSNTAAGDVQGTNILVGYRLFL